MFKSKFNSEVGADLAEYAFILTFLIAVAYLSLGHTNGLGPRAAGKLEVVSTEIGYLADAQGSEGSSGSGGSSAGSGGSSSSGGSGSGGSSGSSGSGSGGGGCFAAETLISMADGSVKPIAQIQLGDRVLAFSEQSLSVVEREVTTVFTGIEPAYLILNDHVRVTPSHGFFANGVWVQARELRVGDKLLNLNGDIEIVRSIKLVEEELEIFNFTVSVDHNYFAAGVLVHNDSNFCYAGGDDDGDECSGGIEPG